MRAYAQDVLRRVDDLFDMRFQRPRKDPAIMRTAQWQTSANMTLTATAGCLLGVATGPAICQRCCGLAEPAAATLASGNSTLTVDIEDTR